MDEGPIVGNPSDVEICIKEEDSERQVEDDK